jgi:ethanolamine utilization microcompartment shell protein EutL
MIQCLLFQKSMSNHEIEVTQISRRMTPLNKDAGTTTGSIMVKPPITIGEFFDTAIRGRDGHGVRLSHVVTTSEVSIFVAGSTLETAEKREAAIHTVADRIKRLANTPEKVMELLDENPFPVPLKKS